MLDTALLQRRTDAFHMAVLELKLLTLHVAGSVLRGAQQGHDLHHCVEEQLARPMVVCIGVKPGSKQG